MCISIFFSTVAIIFFLPYLIIPWLVRGHFMGGDKQSWARGGRTCPFFAESAIIFPIEFLLIL